MSFCVVCVSCSWLCMLKCLCSWCMWQLMLCSDRLSWVVISLLGRLCVRLVRILYCSGVSGVLVLFGCLDGGVGVQWLQNLCRYSVSVSIWLSIVLVIQLLFGSFESKLMKWWLWFGMLGRVIIMLLWVFVVCSLLKKCVCRLCRWEVRFCVLFFSLFSVYSIGRLDLGMQCSCGLIWWQDLVKQCFVQVGWVQVVQNDSGIGWLLLCEKWLQFSQLKFSSFSSVFMVFWCSVGEFVVSSCVSSVGCSCDVVGLLFMMGGLLCSIIGVVWFELGVLNFLLVLGVVFYDIMIFMLLFLQNMGFRYCLRCEFWIDWFMVFQLDMFLLWVGGGCSVLVCVLWWWV